MERLPMTLIAEINALQRMTASEMRAKYPEHLRNMQACGKCETLRARIAYGIQEKYYGISVPLELRRKLEACRPQEPSASPGLLPGTRLVRDWKGRTYEVVVREDGTYEFGEGIYKSLSAVARVITGTNWNGKVFFKIK